jgi:hypothetical protein
VPELEKEFLTTTGRLLLLLGRSGGSATFTDARRVIGSQIYYALKQAITLGLVVEEEEGRRIRLSERGRALAECLAKCFQ